MDTDAHLEHCFTYIDLNMVRAGVVDHPRQWRESRYHEIHNRPERYRIIDREAQWSAGIAVGRRSFLGDVKERLGGRARYRRMEECNGDPILREAD